MMRITLCVLLLIVAGPARAEPTVLYDGRLTVEVPQGFRAATDAEILTKYPRPQRPDHVFTENERLIVTIAVRRTPLPAPATGMPVAALGEMLAERQIGVQPGITLHRHGPVTINGREWYAIDFASMAIDQPVENMLRVTVADGHLVLATANATKVVFAEYEAGLRAALESVVVQ